MGNFNCSIREGQIRKRYVLDVRKYCKFENSNSADNRRSKGIDGKAEENKYIVLCEKKNNFKIQNGKIGSDTRGKFTFNNKSEVG
jgi:hypothetical protein